MSLAFPPELLQRIRRSGVIAVLVIDRVEDGVPLAEALLEGGIDAMELTLRTPVALRALREIRSRVPQMLAGVGTILTVEQVHEAVAAGAVFGVAPGANPRVIRAAGEAGLPFAPGVMTPSDVEQSIEGGCRVLKLFPAESAGGLKHLKNMVAPYEHLEPQFIPLGGVNAANMRAYLEYPPVIAVGGSWIAPRGLIHSGDFKTIAAQARESRNVIDQIRAASEVSR